VLLDRFSGHGPVLTPEVPVEEDAAAQQGVSG
jgi:hypothetical protein